MDAMHNAVKAKKHGQKKVRGWVYSRESFAAARFDQAVGEGTSTPAGIRGERRSRSLSDIGAHPSDAAPLCWCWGWGRRGRCRGMRIHSTRWNVAVRAGKGEGGQQGDDRVRRSIAS